MPGYQFQEISTQDFSRGIDQKSAPSNIPDGFSEDLINVVTDPNGFVSKRPGYEGFYGYLPIRITSIQHSGTNIYFTLDSSINVGNIIESPIVVYGKLSGAQSGDFSTTDAGAYYTTFTTGVRSTLDAPSDTVTVTDSIHGVLFDEVALDVVEATNIGTNGNRWFVPDRLDIANASTFDVDVTGTQPASIEFFTLIANKNTVAGSSYVNPDQTVQYQTTIDSVSGDIITAAAHGLFTGDRISFGATPPAPLVVSTEYYVIRLSADTYSVATTRALAVAGTVITLTNTTAGAIATVAEGYITIAAGTHALSNYNIIPYVYYLDGSEYVKLFLTDFTVNTASGLVNVAITNSTAAAMDVRVVLVAADPADVEVLSLSAGTSGTISISTADAFNFFALYYAAGAVNILTLPDSVEYDDITETMTVSITNSGTSTESFKFFYAAATVQSSVLTVTDAGGISASYTDTAPQLTLWGVPHSEIYDTAANEEGFVNHIDTYRTALESRVIAGLGGNIFGAYERSEVAAAYKIPQGSVDIEGTISTDALIAPAFITTDDAADRTNGNIIADDVVDNKALVTAATFISSGVVQYTLSLTNKSGDLGSVINVTAATADWLTVTGMARAANNGTFKIAAVDNASDTITVQNDAITEALFDETGAMGRAGIFTDRITLSANSKFMAGDIFDAALFGDVEPTVLTSSATTVVLGNVTGRALATAGTALYPVRTTDVIPLTSSMANFVRGDMCTVSGLDRKVRIIAINNSVDVNISSITVAGGIATLTSAAAHGLRTGHKANLLRTGVDDYDTKVTVLTVPNTTSFTFATVGTTTASAGVILGKTIQIDEELAIQDDAAAPVTFTVQGRWLPIEAPISADALPKPTYIKHFNALDYDKQQPLRSTMVKDNLYFTDSYNQVMKFDGTNVYQAGLFRWQPQLFAQIDTTTGSIPLDGTQATVNGAIVANRFVVTDSSAQFKAGDIIIHTDNNATYVVQSVDVANDFIFTTVAITGTNAGTLKLVTRYKYYFRLNAIDANGNIIASAATGKDDFVVDMTAAGQVHMRLLGLPVWGIYDYDALELEVYRTARHTDGPFYRIGVKDVSFAAGAGYIDFQDTVIDDFLADFDPVGVGTGLAPDLGTGWTQPLRAKHITSLGNRLVLGDITDYPTLDITLRHTQGVGSVTAANLDGKLFLFKRDTSDSGTSTSMVDRAKYEFKTSGAVTIVPNTDIATTSTSFTVNEAAHGLAVKDWVYFFHAAAGSDNELDFAGWFQVASVGDVDHFTVTFSGHSRGAGGGAATDVDRYVAATTKSNIPVWLGTDGNYNVVGGNIINEFTAMLRLSNAINSTMRMTNTALSGQTTFVPWMVAQAGNSIGLGRMVIRQEKPMDETLSVVLPSAITGGSIFVGNERQAASAEVDAVETKFQSRVLISYAEYPELFDNPYGDETSSTSIVDINPADGQRLTGIIPFFADSVFGQGAAEGVLAVFKTNSIYVVDLDTRKKTKVQSRGLGCTAPDSIAPTKDGIIFANESGVFKLEKDLSVTPIGENLERIFKDQVNRDQLALLKGHHYGIGQQYKLSVPVGEGQDRNNQVLVYDYRREGQDGRFGAWTRFTNHNATGWANLAKDAFFATDDGQVFRIRSSDTADDFRDDADAVADMEILLRANHFGAPGTRKVVRNVVSHFHLRHSSMEGTEIEMSQNLDGSFESAGTMNLVKGATNKVEPVRSSLPNRKMTYIQLRYTNSTKDESVILAGVDYHAALLNYKGVKESGD